MSGIEPLPAHNGSSRGPKLLADPAMAARGAALGGVALVLTAVALGISRRGGILLAPVSVVLAGLALLAAWSSAIHLTGGERFDDHPHL